MGEEILQTLKADNSAQKSFLQSRWYIFVAGIVLLCACVVCLVAVLLVGVDPFTSLFRDDFVEVSSGEELDVATPVVDSSIPDAMPDAEPPQEQIPVIVISGYYGVVIRPESGDFSHLVFILLRNWMSLTVRQSDITIEGPEPWVDVVGTLEDDGSFIATGRGEVAGFSDIAVTFEGTITLDYLNNNYVLDGGYTMGAEAGLPGGQSVTYRVKGARSGPLEGGTSAPDTETVEMFVPLLEAAVQSGDSEFLLERLHPAAAAFYGTETCQTYFDTFDDPGFNIEILGLSLSGPESWVWEREGLSAYIVDTFAVDSNLTAGGVTNQTEIHFGLINGLLYWFPDCGDPLPQN